MSDQRIQSVALPRLAPWQRQAIGVVISERGSQACEHGTEDELWRLDGPGAVDPRHVGEVLDAILARVPRRRGAIRSGRVIVALSPALVQYKRLFGFPELPDERLAGAVLREGVTRFFRRTDDHLVTSAVERRDDGTRWAAACAASSIEAIGKACHAHGVTLVAVVPLATIAHEPAEARCEDAQMVARLVSQRRAVRCDLAHGVASPAPVSRSVARATALSLAMVVVLSLLAPILAARVVTKRAKAEHDAILGRETQARHLAIELARVSDALHTLGSRGGEGRATLPLLERIGAGLPTGAAVTHLQVDSGGGTLVALAPSADGVLNGLATATAVAEPEIFGPVTRERVGDRDLERVSLRFRHAPIMRAKAAEP